MKFSPYTLITCTMIAIFASVGFISGLLTPRENIPAPHPLAPAADQLERLTGLPMLEFTDEEGKVWTAKWERRP